MNPNSLSAPFPRRVLYLNHAAKPSGAEFALMRMLGNIDRGRVHPVVLFGEEGPANELMRESGIETHVLPLTKAVREVRKDALSAGAFMHLGRLAHFGAYAVQVAAFARRHDIHLIHTNTIKAHLYGALTSRLAGLPVVWHLRDYVNESYFPRAAVQVVRFLARFAPSHIISVSSSVLQQLGLKEQSGRCSVILDGLTDRELQQDMTSRPAPVEGATVQIGIVGRLARWKGQHVFLDAAAQVIAAGIRAEFIIIGAPLFGEEDYEAELRAQAERLGISGQTRFLGFTRDVSGELRKLDFLVHASSTGEPFGQVIIEGMAAGLPVIASRGGGVLEIITDGENGLLTTMGRADELAVALISLLRDPATAARLARAGYEHVRRSFRASNGARAVEVVYESVLAGRQHRLAPGMARNGNR